MKFDFKKIIMNTGGMALGVYGADKALGLIPASVGTLSATTKGLICVAGGAALGSMSSSKKGIGGMLPSVGDGFISYGLVTLMKDQKMLTGIAGIGDVPYLYLNTDERGSSRSSSMGKVQMG